jgi:hypothetical protein
VSGRGGSGVARICDAQILVADFCIFCIALRDRKCKKPNLSIGLFELKSSWLLDLGSNQGPTD